MSVLLVGAGPMAIAYAKVLHALGVSFEAVGRGSRSAAEFAKETGQRAIKGGLSAYLSDHRVDPAVPVIVAVPVVDLAAATGSLVAAGARQLLVEKPAGLDLEQIDAVASVAETSGADISVAYNRRFYASVAKARDIITGDGGVTSFHLDFSELADRIVTPDKSPAVLAGWLLANSSHMFDLAFHLAGEPMEMAGSMSGTLPWHPAASAFAGHGRTSNGALFTWHADWGSAGRWGLDVRTPQRRLLFQPVETLQVQDKSGFSLRPVEIDAELDLTFKPGLYRQVQAFLAPGASNSVLPKIGAHAMSIRRWHSGVFSPS